MQRLLQASAGLGLGAFLISIVGLGPARALALACLVVGCAWLLFGLARLSPELRQVVTFAASASGAAVQFSRRREISPMGETDDNEADDESEEAARLVGGTFKGRPYPLQVGGPVSDRRRAVAFVMLGARVGYRSRDMIGRRLSTDELPLDFPAWRKLSDALVNDRILAKDRKNGCRLALPLADALARLEGVKPLAGDVLNAAGQVLGRSGDW